MPILFPPSVVVGIPTLAQNLTGFLAAYGLANSNAGVDEVIAVLRQPSSAFQAAVRSGDGLTHAALRFRDSLTGLGTTGPVRYARRSLLQHEYMMDWAARAAADALIRSAVSTVSEKKEAKLADLLKKIEEARSREPRKKALSRLFDLSENIRTNTRNGLGERGAEAWISLFGALQTFADLPWGTPYTRRFLENLGDSHLGGRTAEVLLAFERLIWARPPEDRAYHLCHLARTAGDLGLPDMAEVALQAVFDDVNRPIPWHAVTEAIDAIYFTDRMARLYRTLLPHLRRETSHPKFPEQLGHIAYAVAQTKLDKHSEEKIIQLLIANARSIEDMRMRTKALSMLIDPIFFNMHLLSQAKYPILEELFDEMISSARLIPNLIDRHREIEGLVRDSGTFGNPDALKIFQQRIHAIKALLNPFAEFSGSLMPKKDP